MIDFKHQMRFDILSRIEFEMCQTGLISWTMCELGDINHVFELYSANTTTNIKNNITNNI